MPNMTTCPGCGAAYEEISEEEANHPDRRCYACWRARRIETEGRKTVQSIDTGEIEPYRYASMKAAPTNF